MTAAATALAEPRKTEGWRRRRAGISRHIETTGLRLCVAHGIANVSVQQIADEAGISRSTFFRYFNSKDELIAALPRRYAVAMSAAIRRTPSAVGVFGAVRASLEETARLNLQDVPIQELWVRLRGREQDVDQKYGVDSFAIVIRDAMADYLRTAGRPAGVAGPLSAMVYGVMVRAHELIGDGTSFFARYERVLRELLDFIEVEPADGRL
jgi:AcrR family transcriptional regulator